MDGANADPAEKEQRETAPPPVPDAPPVPEGKLKAGDKIGSRFSVDEFLREDVLGRRYAATDQKSGKQVTLLMLDPAVGEDKETAGQLRAQARQATELSHRNITRVFGMGKEGTNRYLAREFVDGQTLADLLEKKAAAKKTFSLKGAYNLIAHLCNAVDAARPVIPHGTLRPSAVLINRTGRVKLVDFGLGPLRGVLSDQVARLNRWDQPCVRDPQSDDLYALGVTLYSLLAGAPPTEPTPTLPEAVAKRVPDSMGAVIRRAVDMQSEDRFEDAAALKAELLHVVEAAGRVDTGSAQPLGPSGSSIELLDEGRATNHGYRIKDAVRSKRPKPPPTKGGGGFAMPDLKGGGAADDDDGSTARWLIEREGTDYGPYTRDQVREQLFEEQLEVNTTLYDIETDRRLQLSEFTAFDEIVVEWAHEKAAREKKRAEAAAKAAARRRTRVLVTVTAVLVLGVGGTVGGIMWYRASLPEPVKAHLSTMMLTMRGALPSVALPEELPETQAEIKARKKASADAAATRRARAEQRKIAEEQRLAASSELAMGSGTGKKFDRGAFNAVMAGRQGKLAGCISGEAKRDPGRKSFTVKVTIMPNGRVINPQMTGASSRGQSCVRRALGGLKVPPFDGTNVKVSLPFNIQ